MNRRDTRFRLSKYVCGFIFLAALCFCFWLASKIPYTHDDWHWGISAGFQEFISAAVNSRYAGNLLVVIMTRSAFLKTVIIGATLFLLPASVFSFLGIKIISERDLTPSFLLYPLQRFFS